MGITKPAIQRLALRGGVKCTSGLICEEARGGLKVFRGAQRTFETNFRNERRLPQWMWPTPRNAKVVPFTALAKTSKNGYAC